MMVKEPTMKERKAFITSRRDEKARDHLTQYAPVWLVNEEFHQDEDAVQFETVFLHSMYGWVRRRYNFDAFNNVLYYLGQVVLPEEEVYELQSKPPYISASTVNPVNNYGG